MGSRREGKDKKKKAVKANVTSKFGSKRRLSRMGKRVKKVGDIKSMIARYIELTTHYRSFP